MDLSEIISAINNFVWGPIMLCLLVGTGVFLTIRLHFLPWRNLGYAIKSVFKRDHSEEHDIEKNTGDISPFQSLMTALAATIGTGNIVGVATAMVLGGPGALVWMWISAIFGLSTKYSESVLAVKYREKNKKGEMCGGPMYALKNGLKNKKLGRVLAFFFALFAVIASFGIGNMTQANSISDAVKGTFGIPVWVVGIILTILTLTVLVGGIKSIGKVCGSIVPIMAIFYFLAGLFVIILNFKNIPYGIGQIFTMAFSTKAMAGGTGGMIIASALRYGVARGVFSNEAGLGSAPIAAAAAKTDHPSRQGYINMTGTFFDTIVVCSVTGLVIASSGVLGSTGSDGQLITGVNLTIAAFSSVLGKAGSWIVTIGIILFAFSTILGWEYYGEKSLEYLIPNTIAVKIYRIFFSLVVYIGSTTTLQLVWDFSDTMNGLMAIPNLICLLLLSNEIAKECFDYQNKIILPMRISKHKKNQNNIS
ncbi:MAG: sodium:alanine symporter family protein [Eubacteriaceae bacterium]|nr:sodium:alanine symporter family protein [Eubacteriaceae bacterium]